MGFTDFIANEMARLLKKASTHTIAKNDNLWDIAKRHNMTLEELQYANPGLDPNRLKIGQVIKIPDATELQKIRDQRAPPKLQSGKSLQKQIDHAIAAACKLYGLSEQLFRGLIYTESRGKIDAVSGRGAQGLTQLMPATQKTVGVTDPLDPVQNVYGGARWLAAMYVEATKLHNKYKPKTVDVHQLALMIYNAGGPVVAKWLAGKGQLPAETAKYAASVKQAAGARFNFEKPVGQV
jgi:soluble lytic murein transglycosylase-like protein